VKGQERGTGERTGEGDRKKDRRGVPEKGQEKG